MAEPLTPADCDLRAFATMPLDAVRLFGSEFHAVASDGAWRAGVTLWLRAWHQVPAASLPDDDVQLARLAELGRDVKAWKKLRSQALHGWIKCDDGRLYHPVVAELANAAMTKRKAFKERSAKANEKRWGEQKDSNGGPKDIQQGDQQALHGDPKERKGKERKGKGEEKNSSVANATGDIVAELPLGDDPSPDPVKALFDAGVALLTGEGDTQAVARSFIGMKRRDFGDEAVMGAIKDARAQSITGVKAWMTKRFQVKAPSDPHKDWLNRQAESYRRGVA